MSPEPTRGEGEAGGDVAGQASWWWSDLWQRRPPRREVGGQPAFLVTLLVQEPQPPRGHRHPRDALDPALQTSRAASCCCPPSGGRRAQGADDLGPGGAPELDQDCLHVALDRKSTR